MSETSTSRNTCEHGYNSVMYECGFAGHVPTDLLRLAMANVEAQRPGHSWWSGGQCATTVHVRPCPPHAFDPIDKHPMACRFTYEDGSGGIAHCMRGPAEHHAAPSATKPSLWGRIIAWLFKRGNPQTDRFYQDRARPRRYAVKRSPEVNS